MTSEFDEHPKIYGVLQTSLRQILNFFYVHNSDDINTSEVVEKYIKELQGDEVIRDS